MAESRKIGLEDLWGSIPGLQPRDVKHYKAKVFKSGNSLAVRIPAGTQLVAGMEMDLRVEDGQHLSLDPVEQPKRKINLDGIAGAVPGLRPFTAEEREFDHSPRVWDDPDWPGWKAP